MNLKGDIKYVDCGESIWMTKKDWKKLKVWFARNGIELDEYKRTPAFRVIAKGKARRR